MSIINRGTINSIKNNGLQNRINFSFDGVVGKDVIFYDGTPAVLTMRGIELILTGLVGYYFNNIADRLITQIVGGGCLYYILSDLEHSIELKDLFIDKDKVNKLQSFFKEFILDDKSLPFLPPNVFLTYTGITMKDYGIKTREFLVNRLKTILGIDIELEIQRVEDLPISQTIVSELFSDIDDFMFFKFVCIECSRQRGVPVEHCISVSGRVTKNSGGRVKCKHAKRIESNWEVITRMRVSELIELGFYLTGKALYFISLKSLNNNNVVLIRNYSNDRNTIPFILSNWKGNVFLTKRYYLPSKLELPAIMVFRLIDSTVISWIKNEVPIVRDLDNDDGNVYIPLRLETDYRRENRQVLRIDKALDFLSCATMIQK